MVVNTQISDILAEQNGCVGHWAGENTQTSRRKARRKWKGVELGDKLHLSLWVWVGGRHWHAKPSSGI